MKRYKLIKTYPGSVPIGTVAVENLPGKYVAQGLVMFDAGEIENYPEYWEKVKDREFKKGDWVVTTTSVDKERYCRPDVGEVFRITGLTDDSTILLYSSADGVRADRCRLASASEIEEELRKQALIKGYKEGVWIEGVPHKDANVDRMVISNIYFSSNVIDGDGPYLYTNGQYIYIDGKWANIIKNTPVTIGEYPVMWNTSRTILEVGCKSYKSSEVLELYLVMKKLNISEIRIERHTVTYSQVISLIKQLN